MHIGGFNEKYMFLCQYKSVTYCLLDILEKDMQFIKY